MDYIERIELADFLLIAEGHTGIPAEVLASNPRVVALASAALAAPFAGFGDFEAHPEFHAKAAVLCARIVKYHALPDGNKRTGVQCMIEFTERNDRDFAHPDGDQMQTAAIVESLAAGEVDEATFAAWIRERITPP